MLIYIFLNDRCLFKEVGFIGDFWVLYYVDVVVIVCVVGGFFFGCGYVWFDVRKDNVLCLYEYCNLYYLNFNFICKL